jgi:hypothetical protein
MIATEASKAMSLYTLVLAVMPEFSVLSGNRFAVPALAAGNTESQTCIKRTRLTSP